MIAQKTELFMENEIAMASAEPNVMPLRIHASF